MTLWRLELLRLVRTRRIWILVGVFLLFGVTGPVGARYLPELIERFGGGVEIVLPDPTAVDGMGQFLSNAGQLGLLAVLAITAAAMAFDSRPEWSAFLRTRAGSMRDLVLPRVTVAAAGAVAGLVVGTVTAVVLTGLLIEPVPLGDAALGTVLAALYLAFAVSVVAVAATFTTSTMSAVLLSVGVLLVLPILQAIPPLADWIPSRLLGATADLLRGTPVRELLPATLLTLVAVPALLEVAIRRLARRVL